MKYRIGDIVKVREDLIIGENYFNDDGTDGDTFARMMLPLLGKTVEIVNYNSSCTGYIVQHGNYISMFTFYDDMFEDIDDKDSSEYVFNEEVESLVLHLEKEWYKKLIDKGLDDRIFETDPEEFKKIVSLYNECIDKCGEMDKYGFNSSVK